MFIATGQSKKEPDRNYHINEITSSTDTVIN
jgi:hypothetical protein